MQIDDTVRSTTNRNREGVVLAGGNLVLSGTLPVIKDELSESPL
jgi:hypothetical protein